LGRFVVGVAGEGSGLGECEYPSPVDKLVPTWDIAGAPCSILSFACGKKIKVSRDFYGVTMSNQK